MEKDYQISLDLLYANITEFHQVYFLAFQTHCFKHLKLPLLHFSRTYRVAKYLKNFTGFNPLLLLISPFTTAKRCMSKKRFLIAFKCPPKPQKCKTCKLILSLFIGAEYIKFWATKNSLHIRMKWVYKESKGSNGPISQLISAELRFKSLIHWKLPRLF